MQITVEGILIAVGWLTSLAVAILVVPRIAARRVCEQFGLTLVQQGGKSFYVPLDPAGDPIQVPIGVKEENGEQKVVMGYAPLAYTMPVLAAEYAATKIRLSFQQAKGVIAKKLNAEALAAGMDIDGIAPFLPKKIQAAVAIARALGLGGNSPGNGGQSKVDSTYKPGLR